MVENNFTSIYLKSFTEETQQRFLQGYICTHYQFWLNDFVMPVQFSIGSSVDIDSCFDIDMTH